MCVCSGEGIPCIPAHPGGLRLPRSFLPSWRRGSCALLCSDGGSWSFSPSSELLDKHPLPIQHGCLRVLVAMPTRGCAWEAARLPPLLHRQLVWNTVGCSTALPLTGLMCMNRVSSCLRSPAWDCYPFTSLIFPNLYICFRKFSRKLRSNLFHPVIPSCVASLPPPPCFFSLADTSCIM